MLKTHYRVGTYERRSTDPNRRIGWLTILSVAACLMIVPSFAQYLPSQDAQLVFRQMLDGLSQSTVKCFAEDSYGFMWLGTEGGLNRFDGLTITQYHVAEAEGSLPDNRIQDLLVDSDHNLWIGTYNAIARFDYFTNRFVVYENPEPNRPIDVLSLCETKEGDLLIGTLHGIFILKKGQQKVIRHPDRNLSVLQNIRVNSIVQEDNRGFWLATSEGLFYWDERGAHRIEGIDKRVSDIVVDGSGLYWIGTEANALIRMRYENYRALEIKRYDEVSIGDNRVFDIYVDRQGRLLVGTERGGLNLYDALSDDFHSFKKDYSSADRLKTNSIWKIFEDSAGRLWLGSGSQGAFIHDPYRAMFSHVFQDDGQKSKLKVNTVSSFLQVGDKVWIGTDGGGISVWDPRNDTYEFLSYDASDKGSLRSDEVLAIHQDREGSIWVGNWDGGLHLYRPATKSFECFRAEKGQVGSNSIFAIDEDNEGNLWLATWGQGVTRYDRKTQKFSYIGYAPNVDSLLSSDLTYDVEFDDLTADIWVATVEGLDRCRFDDKKSLAIEHYNTTRVGTPVDGHIKCIFQDRKQNIWVGGSNGLFLYNRDDNSFSRYSTKDGLPDNDVRSIIQDDAGGLWIATNNGLAYLKDVAPPISFVNFSVADGLQSSEFFGGAAYKSHNGALFFGGVNGFNYFFPEEILMNSDPPLLQFTNLTIFNEPADFGGSNSPLQSTMLTTAAIELTPDQSVFSIEYAGINFTNPEQNQYAFMLEPFEENWNFVGNRTVATYTNLDPGEYTFRLRAADQRGRWTETEKRLTIVVLPPWYRTWWAWLLYTLTPVVIFIGVYRVRVSVLQKQKRALEAEVARRTEEISAQNKILGEMNAEKDGILGIVAHDLRAPFNTIAGLLQLIGLTSKVDREQAEYFEKINHAIAKGKQLITDLLDISNFQSSFQLKIEAVEIPALFEELRESQGAAATDKHQALIFRPKVSQMMMTDRLLLYRLVENLLSNAIKYSPEGGTIKVEAMQSDDVFEFSVSDEGPGFSVEDKAKMFRRFQRLSARPTGGEHSTGLGLSIVKMIVDKLGGTIDIVSEPGKGATFRIRIRSAPVEFMVPTV